MINDQQIYLFLSSIHINWFKIKCASKMYNEENKTINECDLKKILSFLINNK